jgi:hypothetical protein
MTTMAPAYEDRLLAFVDVLGWADLIRRTVAEPELIGAVDGAAQRISFAPADARQSNTMSLVHSRALACYFGTDDDLDERIPDLRITHFSDTYVVSSPATERDAAQLVGFVSKISTDMLTLGHYVRGAIVRGLIRHSDGILYGPALIDAYQIEQHVAKYPRIIVSPEACEVFPRFTHWVREDFDGLMFLDTLFRYKWSSFQTSDLALFEKTVYEKLSRDTARLDLVAKHRWFLNYLERVKADCATSVVESESGVREDKQPRHVDSEDSA